MLPKFSVDYRNLTTLQHLKRKCCLLGCHALRYARAYLKSLRNLRESIFHFKVDYNAGKFSYMPQPAPPTLYGSIDVIHVLASTGILEVMGSHCMLLFRAYQGTFSWISLRIFPLENRHAHMLLLRTKSTEARIIP